MEEDQLPNPTVMSTGVKFGVIIAAVSILIFVLKIAFGLNPLVSDWSNWAGLLVSVVIVVFAHKSFKDGGDGYMTYGQAFGIGAISMLLSLVIGGLFTFIYTSFIDTTLMEQMLTTTEEKMREQGQSDEAINMAIDWTKKLFWPFYLLGGGFFCLVIAAIVSIFTQKKNEAANL